MGLSLAIAALVIAAIIALYNWRAGIFAVVVLGFLQDPLRKLVPGEPVVFTLLAALIFGICFLSALVAGESLNFRDIMRWDPVLLLPGLLFILWISDMVIKTLVTTGSAVLAGIGAMAYLAPVFGLLLGYRFAQKQEDIQRLIIAYLIVNVVFCLSLYLERAGVPWPVLGSVGEGFVFYPESGGVSILYAGLFRSPEIAGWHAATGICFVLLLGLGKRQSTWYFVFAAVVILILLPALVITGRRKFLAEIVIFLGFSGFLIGYFRYGLQRFAYALATLAIVSAIFYYYITSSELPGEWMGYFERSASTGEDATDRFKTMTFGMFQWVIAQNGVFGSGAGTGSQGAQHFGGGAALVGAAAEGGLGKVLAELGIPGVLLLLWLLIAMIRYIFGVCKGVKEDAVLAPMVYCFVGFLGANAIVFTTAHQIFGDVNILILLGLIIGFVMRSPFLVRGRVFSERTVAAKAKRPRLGRRFAGREKLVLEGTGT